MVNLKHKAKTNGFPILILIIFLAAFATDYYISNSQLSLPLIITSILSIIIIDLSIPKLKELKIHQIIRAEGPQGHLEKKGTPTMGGLIVIPISLFIGNILIFTGPSKLKILAISFLCLSYMVIGAIDDLKSLSNNTNIGLTAKWKIILQLIGASIFILICELNSLLDSNIILIHKISIEIGFFIIPLALFICLAESNSTNLTDGLDGLASGCGALVFTGIAIELIMRGNNGDAGLASFCMCMSGSWIGFLFHNKNPAKVFMGDTGSLAMGAGLAGIGLLSNSLWAVFLMGGVFVAEAISVILQVAFFKLTKKINGQGQRILLMAPLHHHYELKGDSESKIVNSFWLTTLLLVLIGILLRPIN